VARMAASSMDLLCSMSFNVVHLAPSHYFLPFPPSLSALTGEAPHNFSTGCPIYSY
jgi:hypothetical protein